MNITYSLVADDGTEYPEAAAASFALSGKLPGAAGDFDGEVRFSHQGQEDALLSDDLSVLVPNLLTVYLEAESQGAATLAMSSHYRQYALKISGDSVSLEDATLPPEGNFPVRKYPRADFKSTLTACGQRFERFLVTLLERDPQWGGSLESLRAVLAKLA